MNPLQDMQVAEDGVITCMVRIYQACSYHCQKSGELIRREHGSHTDLIELERAAKMVEDTLEQWEATPQDRNVVVMAFKEAIYHYFFSLFGMKTNESLSQEALYIKTQMKALNEAFTKMITLMNAAKSGETEVIVLV